MQGQHGNVVAAVLQGHIGKASDIGVQPFPILLPIGCVDHQHVPTRTAHVDDHVIDHAPVRVEQEAVVGFPRHQSVDVTGGHQVQKGRGEGSGGLKDAHVSHVEQARRSPYRPVFVQHRPVAQWHLPSAEGDKVGP